MRKRMLAAVLLLCAALMPAAAFAARYEVGNQEQFLAAIAEINAGSSASDEIVMTADIDIGKGNSSSSNTVVLRRGDVTLFGEGHTLTLYSYSLGVTDSAKLSLGAADYGKTLKLVSRDNTQCLIGLTGNGQLFMYDGVSMGESSYAGGQAAGVGMNGSSQFTMYGGRIYECHNWASVAGGVFVDDNCVFTMYDGVIENCSGWQGGAVGVSKNGVFNMKGGTISGCTDYWYGGGGVCAMYGNPKFTMDGGVIRDCVSDGSDAGGGAVFMYGGEVELNAGEITGSESNIYAGGVLVHRGKATISSAMKIHNNTAAEAADDVMVYDGTVSLGDVPSGLKLEECGDPITGWYVDGALNAEDYPRWNVHESGEVSAVAYTPGSGSVPHVTGLKAAHGDVIPGANLPATGDRSQMALLALVLTGAIACGALLRAKKEA